MYLTRLGRGDLPLGNTTKTNNPEVLEGGHDPILPPTLCDSVGIITKNRSEIYKRPHRTSHVYLISDVARCAVCGNELRGSFQGGYRRYRHQYARKGDCPESWMLADDLENQVLEYLCEISQGHILESVKKKAGELAREAFAKNVTSKPLLDQLEHQHERLTRLEDLYLDGDIDKDRYLARKSEITQAISGLEDELYAITQAFNFPKVLNRMEATLAKLPTAPPETKKTLINSMIERLEVGGGKIIHIKPRPWATPFF